MQWEVGRVEVLSFHPAFPLFFPFSPNTFLLDDEHLPRGGIVPCGQVIEVHTTCYLFTELVTTIPVDCFRPRFVRRCGFITHIYASHNPSGCIVDGQCHESILCQPIRYPCLRIERIGIISQQFRLRWYFVDCQFWQLNPAPPHIFSGDGIPQRLHTD